MVVIWLICSAHYGGGYLSKGLSKTRTEIYLDAPVAAFCRLPCQLFFLLRFFHFLPKIKEGTGPSSPSRRPATVYEILNSVAPEYLIWRIVSRNSVSAYRLRNTESKLLLPQPRTDYLKRSFWHNGAQLWNNLPIELRQASSLTDFKSKLSHRSFK